VTYRRQAGFDLNATSMAVVVQKMAFCDVAGVGFSFNPVSGNLDEQVFDANYGLGESVVGGEARVDHFTVDKRTGALLGASVAEKEFKIVAAPNGAGTMAVPLATEERMRPCLNPEQIKSLSRLLVDVDSLYGCPQDIEWGFDRGQLRLLQSRPITRIPARWTRDESAERFPSVITPLAWALVEEGFHKSLNYSFSLMGLPPFRDKWFALFDHYVYGNQNAVEIYATGAASHIKIGSLPDLIATIPVLREQYQWVLELPLTWSRDLDHYLLCIGELMAEPLDGRSIPDLWKFVLRVKDLGAEYFLPNIAISITQRTLYRVLHGLLNILMGPAQAPIVFDRLLAYCETKTGVINKELYRFAARIAEKPSLVDELQSTSAAEFLRGRGFSEHPELDRLFLRFLRDHGHREVEFDPYQPTWAEEPALVIDNLKVMLDSHRADPAIKEREAKIVMSETEAAVAAQAPDEIRFFVRELIRLARVYTTLDDVEHYQTTRLTIPLRKGLRALGTALQKRSILMDPMDIFFAPYATLDAAIKADDHLEWERLGEAVRQEKQAYDRHRRETPLWEWGVQAAVGPDDSILTGLAGSPGIASGPVFKVLGSEDFGMFPKGAVLVARTTNPAWTPLFYKAAAVITESGGPLSHGAVTAREIGLPAVMSVRTALIGLTNGQQVTVDGTTGRVYQDKLP
jgi:rifampicin phosphotransferase